MLWLPYSAPPDPLAKISNILFEIITEMLRKKSNSKLVTAINIIFDCIKELFMLVIAFCTACFSRIKINIKLWLLYFECSGAGTVSGR